MAVRIIHPIALALGAMLAVPSVASATHTTGGSAMDQGPQITSVRCLPLTAAPCPGPATAPPGAQIQVRGSSLATVRTVTFRGGAGRSDDVTVRARHVRPTHVEAPVPPTARTGRLELRATGGTRAVTRATVEVVQANTPVTGQQVFPIRGKHDLGQSATNSYGGGRGHQGQDLFAACGTPLVVAEGGTVRRAASEGSAGNHAVLTGALTGRDYVYMHMRAPALVTKGQAVTVGQPLGEVGDSGNASGCHLHFEIWTAPGWYKGGTAIDPLPELEAWDALDGAHAH